MKLLLLIITLLLPVGSIKAQGVKFSEYPNTNNLFDTMMLLWAITGQTNMTTFWRDLRSIAQESVGNQVWSAVARPFEIMYDPFNGSAYNSGGTFGTLGWEPLSSGTGGSGIIVSNDVGHWGVASLANHTNGNSIQTMFLSSIINSKPMVPPLNAYTGWTNRFIWRIVGTNSCKAYAVLQAGNLGNATLENSIGFFINTTNSNQIRAHTSAASVATTTDLGAVEDGVWFTNEMWSTASGTIRFNLNGGSPVSINTTVPTTALTPAFSVIKSVANTPTNHLQVDDWILLHTK